MKNLERPFALRDIHYQLLRCIETFIQWNGYSPSVRELVAIMAEQVHPTFMAFYMIWKVRG